MIYSLISLNNTVPVDTWGSAFMPALCDHLINASCPLQTNQKVTYLAPFNISQDLLIWSAGSIAPMKFLLQFDLYEDEKENINGYLLPVFILKTKILLESCLVHLFC